MHFSKSEISNWISGGKNNMSNAKNPPNILLGSHDPLLAGKNWKCKGGGLLELGTTTAKAFNDKRCPDFQPDPGWNNTCKQNAGEEGLGIDLVGENPD